MGKNATKTCDICFKTMRGGHFKRHMMKHMNRRKEEKEEQKDNEVQTEVMRVEQKYEMIAKSMEMAIAESKRKIELGRIMTDIAERRDMNTSLLPKDMQEAIEAYEKFGKNIEKRDIQWKGWQQKLRGYLNEKCDRKIFWVVGREGGEGKTFFQKNIQFEFGKERVSVIPLVENERNTFHVLKKYTSRITDTFLFNIPKGQYMLKENYQILEQIKDGLAITGKFDSSLLMFKEKNIVIVFSNKYPDKSHLSKDRWRIFEITKDLEDIVEKDAKSEAYGKQEKIRRDKSEDSLSEDHYSD